MTTNTAPTAGFKLPNKIKKDWIEALNSGKYKQGKYSLRSDDTDAYCCLGVLQMVVDGKCEQDVWGNYRGTPSDQFLERIGAVCTINGLPAWASKLWVGNPNCDEPTADDDARGWLPVLNDGYGLEFKEIARLIDKYVEGY